ncbi:fimbrial assembly protein [[Pantoea] beijingensis]|uniref:Fimbrial assembly protein n=1 Tax=[Pantoea] beijingensis TaxID=1324864 RepID=A0A443IAC2_9GAMM|nr:MULTISPECIES: molecular chaperone [Erwiniaceae]RWR01118.1 fimbrial assembly protein [[Pantoea] beijingensis]
MLRLLLTLCLLTASLAGRAGVEIGGTRLIYDANAKQATLSVNNPDDRSYLIQSWVDKDPAAGDGDNTFVTTPPLFRLEPHSQNSVRVVYTGRPLPADRESMLWLSIKSVPSISKDETNRLLISVKSVLKLFYRPAGLSGEPATAYEKLTFVRRGGQVYVSNPTPYYVSFYDLSIGGLPVKSLPTLKPLSGQSLDVPAGTAGAVSWRAINDFGGITDVRKAKI